MRFPLTTPRVSATKSLKLPYPLLHTTDRSTTSERYGTHSAQVSSVWTAGAHLFYYYRQVLGSAVFSLSVVQINPRTSYYYFSLLVRLNIFWLSSRNCCRNFSI